MKLLTILFFLLLIYNLEAQVKTITLRKAEPYDTQHVVLSFTNDAPIMPKFNGGKNNFDATVTRIYNNNIIARNSADKEIRKANASKSGNKNETNDSLETESDSCFYEGNPFDKAKFVYIKTYCDTDGSIIVLPQDLSSIYTLAAIQIVRKLPRFKPAQFDESPVPVYLTIPIRFLKELKYLPIQDNKIVPNRKHHCWLSNWIVNGKKKKQKKF